MTSVFRSKRSERCAAPSDSSLRLQASATAAFATLAFAGASIPLFALVMAGDNFGLSFAGVALVAYMSSLTNLGYTATQYALLSSTYAWLGKILKGFPVLRSKA